MKPDDPVDTTTNGPGGSENVVRISDWLCSPDEFVPIGPRADALAAEARERDRLAANVGETLSAAPLQAPPAASDFWDEGAASVHSPIQGPAPDRLPFPLPLDDEPPTSAPEPPAPDRIHETKRHRPRRRRGRLIALAPLAAAAIVAAVILTFPTGHPSPRTAATGSNPSASRGYLTASTSSVDHRVDPAWATTDALDASGPAPMTARQRDNVGQHAVSKPAGRHVRDVSRARASRTSSLTPAEGSTPTVTTAAPTRSEPTVTAPAATSTPTYTPPAASAPPASASSGSSTGSSGGASGTGSSSGGSKPQGPVCVLGTLGCQATQTH